MSDLKSKLPDLQEVTGIVGKLFGDIKKSVLEIVKTYQEKHPSTQKKAPKKTGKTEKSEKMPKEK